MNAKQTDFRAPGHVTVILQVKNEQKLEVSTDIDKKCFMIFEHTINHLPLVIFIYPNLNNFLLFSFFFLFLHKLFKTFNPLNAQYLQFEQLKTSWRTRVRLKSIEHLSLSTNRLSTQSITFLWLYSFTPT